MINGIPLEGKKEASLISWSFAQIKEPTLVRIPLVQFSGIVSTPCVSVGDLVKAGEKIADPAHPFDTALHASISGTVTRIAKFPHPVFQESEAIEIEWDEKNQVYEGIGEERAAWGKFKKEEIKEIFRDAGLVELDEEGVPLHWKISDASFHKIKTLVLNVCNSDPYISCDYSLCMSHPVEILRGAEILRSIVSADRVVVAFTKDQLEAADLMKSKIFFLKWNHFEIRVIPSMYPQGMALPLIHSLFEIDLVPYYRELRGASPAEARPLLMTQTLHRAGIAVHSPATAYAVYEAIMLQKPLYQRAVTVAGECVIEPRNFWVPLGLSFQAVMKGSKGVMREPDRLLMGGPMRGIAQSTSDVPVLKTTRGILALPPEVTRAGKEAPCIHCARCVEACPVEISPVMITLASEHNLFEEAQSWGLETCIDCGICTYVCPSKRPMAGLIEQARRGMKALQRSNQDQPA